MSEPIIWKFKNCEVWEWPDADDNGVLITKFQDGSECSAARSSEMRNLDYARHLGYDNVRDALREHELAHVFYSEKLGFPYSPTLYAVARNYAPGTAPYEQQLAEEAIVLDAQRYMNTGEIGVALSPYAWRMPEWAAEFRARFCDPPPEPLAAAA